MISFSLVNRKNGWLSNFYPCTVVYEGLTYKSSEAAYQAAKTLNQEERLKFTEYDAKTAKKKGKRLKIREDWEDIKYKVMVDVDMSKFTQNEDLREKLLATGTETLFENTTRWHDNTWGCCNCEKCKDIVGMNLLGKALEEVRENLRSESQ